MKKIFIGLFLVIVFQASQSIEKKSYLTYALGQTTLGLTAHLALGIIHELGHWGLSKFLLHRGASIHSDTTNTISLNPNLICPLLATYPFFEKTRQRILVEAIGPISALLAGYGILKFANIYNEVKKNNNLWQDLKAGITKRIINADQPRILQLAVLGHTAGNIYTLLPFKTPTISGITTESQPLHGYRIAQDLEFIK